MVSFSRCFVVLALAVLGSASSGDRAHIYQNCVSICHAQRCVSPSTSLPLFLRLTQWTCTDDCKYGCMHTITDKAVEAGLQVEQYYGKWPFWRLFGMQEPASVAFSLLNLWFHAQGARQILSQVPSKHPMKLYYLVWAFISVNAWTWSSIFHTRDLPFTEKLDYLSAAMAILFALYYTVLRFYHLYPLVQGCTQNAAISQQWRKPLYLAWSSACTIIYIAHVSYLTLPPRFDYSYNILFNLSLGLIHNFLWLAYSLPASFSVLRRFPFRPKSYRPKFASKAAVFVLLTTAATALELFDFPPWGRIIDAHSLWHLSTAPIVKFWYDFLIEDALDDGWRDQRM
ncbi:hypothetical protein SERLA73DRAFT_59005 [Serpula lacrymans var. lacrymans S7.3]|uniref:Post-GPI attachment to proteins factor 3 n=2 Tax=Serpula lacrymans var. lacrymans TaxID=341189 RepID=F8Q6X4_SERL3|nr:hypothetical protein SERLA73DRAFT_59005 [Serpula lacrymans var. lacrymans S7.3]